LVIDEFHFVVEAFCDAVVAGEAPHGGDPVKIAELKHRAALVAGIPVDAEFEVV
jgi:hypothetical protein